MALASVLVRCGPEIAQANDEAQGTLAVSAAQEITGPANGSALSSWTVTLSRYVIAPNDANYRENFRELKIERRNSRGGVLVKCQVAPIAPKADNSN